MPSKYESEIQRLEGLKKKESELKGKIANCDTFIQMIQVQPDNEGLTVGKPRVTIQIDDDYKDGDYWQTVALVFSRDDDFRQSVIDTLIKLAEEKKNRLTVELHDLP